MLEALGWILVFNSSSILDFSLIYVGANRNREVIDGIPTVGW